MSSPESNSNGSDMTPQFPPEDIEMPDISMTNSLTSAVAMMAPPTQAFSNNNGMITTSSVNFQNSLNNKNSPRQESSEESSDDSLPLAQVSKMF
jgi:hypothetical protein